MEKHNSCWLGVKGCVYSDRSDSVTWAIVLEPHVLNKNMFFPRITLSTVLTDMFTVKLQYSEQIFFAE